MFVVIEGIDGTGKSTLSRRLATKIELATDRKCMVTHEPSSGPLEHYIRNAFKNPDTELLSAEDMATLFTADRVIHMHEKVRPALATGKIVICDRHKLTTLAYQQVSGCDVDKLKMLCDIPKPNPTLTILLDMPAELSYRRMIERNPNLDKYESNMVQQEKMRQIYLKHRNDFGPSVVIDATQSEDDVADTACFAIAQFMKGNL